MENLDTVAAREFQAAVQCARQGDLAQARARAEALLIVHGSNAAIRSFAGMICCQVGDLRAGIPHLRAALRVNKRDVSTAANLAMALMEVGTPAEALQICNAEIADLDNSLRLWRLRGFLLQTHEDHKGAADAYAKVVAKAADDFESWNNMGNALCSSGDVSRGLTALECAVALRPDIAPLRLNLATALLDAERLDEAVRVLKRCTEDFPDDATPLIELGALQRRMNRNKEALAALEQAILLVPDDASLQVRLGEERVILWKLDEAEQAFRAALIIDPRLGEATVQLAMLLEHTNRIKELSLLIGEAEEQEVDAGSLHFVRALICRREQKFEEGLVALAGVPEEIEPIRRAQLEGEFRDRLGQCDAAFAAFAEVNRLLTLDPSDPVKRSLDYREALQADRAIVTADWYATWQNANPAPSRPSPVFLLGFPRSGTTLLDTILMGHPGVAVIEERPALRRVQDAIGGIDRLPDLGEADIEMYRALYFREVDNYLTVGTDRLLVDKFPLNLNKVPLIHRLFPDARFILALRHPCDVVLSCLITSFRLNNAMANFLDLETTAHTYDQTFSFWEQSREIMPISVYTVKYESMVQDSEAELRPMFDFLELDWHAEALDHRRTAAARGAISTASYSQVTEPLYSRATGRWERYRPHLEAVLPILSPWVDRLGYAL